MELLPSRSHVLKWQQYLANGAHNVFASKENRSISPTLVLVSCLLVLSDVDSAITTNILSHKLGFYYLINLLCVIPRSTAGDGVCFAGVHFLHKTPLLKKSFPLFSWQWQTTLHFPLLLSFFKDIYLPPIYQFSLPYTSGLFFLP